MIEVECVDFLTIPTRDPERSRRFYVDLLGLRPSDHSDDEFETANLTLSLWEPERDGLPLVPLDGGFAIRVPDVAEARRLLEAAGVEFLGDTRDTGVCLMALCRDPDGNVVILHRRYAAFR